MSALFASVAAYTVLFTMLIAFAEHLSKPALLSRALTAQAVVPKPSTVAAAVIASEGLLGTVGILALLGDGGRPLVAALAGSAALLGLYGGYGLHLQSTGSPAACGCSRLELPMTGWVVTRAFALAAMALVGLVLSGSIVPLARPGAALAIVLLAAATFTVLLWHLPAAMHEATPLHEGRDVPQGGVPG